MNHPTTSIRLAALAAGAALLLPACDSGAGAGSGTGPQTQQEILLSEGIEALSVGEYEKAQSSFSQLVTEQDYECEAHYGLVLAGIQDTADRIDTFVDAAAAVWGAAPGYQPAQTNLLQIVENLLEPFEEFFAEMLEGTGYVIANGCKLVLENGFPVELGEPDSLIYFRARFGYEFDASAARAIQSAVASAEAGIRFLLAHQIEINLTDLNDTIDIIIDAAIGSQELEIDSVNQDVTIPTYLSAVRASAVLFERNPNLLTLGNLDRFNQVDNDITLAIRTIYDPTGPDPVGLIPQLEAEAIVDPDTTDNILGLVDANGNGRMDEGDSVVIGLRELHLSGAFSEPSIEGGILLNLTGGLGDYEAIITAVHEILAVLGDQFASVDDDSISSRRLGLAEVNDLIDAVDVLDLYLSPVPEAVEVDFGAYFETPTGVRSFLPYWTDHDNDDSTSAEYLVEGEGWLTNDNEPYVSFGDTAHFTGSYVFVDGDPAAATHLNALTIPADGIEPPDEAALIQYPLPYVAFQDASFNGVLFIDVSELPVSPDSDLGFKAGTIYSVNKAANAYAAFAIDEWLRP